MLKRNKFSVFLIKSFQAMLYLSVIGGPLFAGIGIWMGMSLAQFVDGSTEAQAVVIRMDEKKGENRRMFRPVFEVTDQGQQVQYAGSLWNYPPLHGVGDVVDGRFDRSSGKIMSDAGIEASRSLNNGLKYGGLFYFVLGVGYFAWRRFSPKRA